MNASKFHLLAATAVAALFTATSAQAAVVYAAADVHGNGASSIINVLNKTEQCLGVDNPIGIGSNGTTQLFPTHNYAPVAPTVGNPNYDCASKTIQPNLDFKYVSTGSGGGRTNWSKYVLTGIVSMPPSFSASYTSDGHIQYALSDSALTSTNLSDYTANVPVAAGAAIQIPFYVLPIAVTYSPVYGKRDIASVSTPLALNVKAGFVQKDGAGNVTGGLRMKKATYCGIMNGTITNWNDAALTADNGGQSLKDPNDTTDWSAAGPGVPIKLVGRSDNSGTTNLFSRHLAAACAGTDFSTQATGADQLPAARKGTAVYSASTGAVTAGTETAGKFGLVSGSSGIANTVGQTIADPAPGSNAVNLGGYLGYVGADFVRPAIVGTTSPVLYAAALAQGTSTTTFKMPTAVNATAAFGTTYLPPESATTGKYVATAGCNSATLGCRKNPLSWALAPNATTGLANPATGYPIVGTTNLLLYTCYNSAAKRNAITALAGLQFGKVVVDSTGAKVPAALANSTANGADLLPVGILSRNGLANLPASWKNAIWETFFSKSVSGNNAASLNLWIQTALPTTQAQITTDTLNQPICTVGQGA